uniref:WW domain containing adaptor with coiled-coil n=1 Tax=Panagrolaimus davidi TaxID=227884 RepID=A0A914R267_9BILA
MPSGSESVRKVADVSSPPPLIPESKSNTDSLMLPVSTPPMTPVQLGSLQVSTPPLAPPISSQQPTTSVQSGSLQPLPTIPKAPINKLDDPQTKN